MAQERPPDQFEIYPELISPMEDRTASPEEMERALATVRLAMEGLEKALAQGLVVNAQVNFEIVSPEGNLEFNYSAPEEEQQ